MELRDFFAAHIASALAHRVEQPEVIAGRAYELADALLREREQRPLSVNPPAESSRYADDHYFNGLLDEPQPPSERDLDDDMLVRYADRQFDARWETSGHWQRDNPSGAERPGLSRTLPQREVPLKKAE